MFKRIKQFLSNAYTAGSVYYSLEKDMAPEAVLELTRKSVLANDPELRKREEEKEGRYIDSAD